MPISHDVPWKDLETKGFVQIPGFLSAAELALCREDFAQQPVNASNRNNPVSDASPRGITALQASVVEVLTLVNLNTDIRVDLGLGGLYFATKRGVTFPWHQDHESYFGVQNHYDYLNFFIPVVKPAKNKSNLCVVPFDLLERESPKAFRRLVRSGATMVYDLGVRRMLSQADSGSAHMTRTSFDRVSYTPQLAAGDLLLMRGDMLHRTEDGDTERVALSIRAGNSKTVVSRARLADGGFSKAKTMAGNFGQYEVLFRAFDASGKDELPLSELLRHVSEVKDLPAEVVERPRRYLLKQKVRSGVLWSSAAKAVNELITHFARVPYVQRQARQAQRAGQTPEPTLDRV